MDTIDNTGDYVPLDIDGVRDEIARISGLARAAFGSKFHFATVTIWGPEHRGRHVGVEVRLHIYQDSRAFSGATPAEAIADAETYIASHAPAAVEAAGWAILGVIRA